MKQKLCFLASLALTFSGISGVVTSQREANPSVVEPEVVDRLLATVEGKQVQGSAQIGGDAEAAPWNFYTDIEAYYSGNNVTIPGIKTPNVPFGSKQIAGYATSDIASYIVVEEAVPGMGSQFALYQYLYTFNSYSRRGLIFSPGVVTDVTAVGLVNIPSSIIATESISYLIAAGISGNDTILTGVQISYTETPIPFPAQMPIYNTHFQNFSNFYYGTNRNQTINQKMYYASNQYNSSTSAWSNGWIGSLSFEISNGTIILKPNNGNRVYLAQSFNCENLRFSFYQDEQLLAWDGSNPNSNQFYWVDIATAVGYSSGIVYTPLLTTISWINNTNHQTDFKIIVNTLGLISASYNFDWNTKSVTLLSQVYLRTYNEVFSGFIASFTGGTYGIHINVPNNQTQIYKLGII